jgi:DNA-binding Lrp family transcriptional regulator
MAQDNSGYTSVALFKVKPDGAGAFVESVKKVMAPVGDKLLKEGTIAGYGLNVDMFHQPGAPNAALWIDVPNFAAFGKMEEAIGAAMKASPQAMAGIMAATDPAAHSDLLVRHLFMNMKKAPAGTLPYTNFYSVKVKPGKMEEFSQAFEKHQKPIYDKLVADGAILGYAVDTEVIHTEAGDTVWILTVMADLSGKDKTLAATRAAPDRRAATVLMNALTVEGSHRDNISQSVIFVTK